MEATPDYTKFCRAWDLENVEPPLTGRWGGDIPCAKNTEEMWNHVKWHQARWEAFKSQLHVSHHKPGPGRPKGSENYPEPDPVVVAGQNGSSQTV